MVEQVRAAVADTLCDGVPTKAEVAFFTGFAGQSAFTRAFKRWTGETPLAYRQQAG